MFEECEYVLGGRIATSQPDYLRRETIDQAELVEVRIERHDDEFVFFRVAPDCFVVGLVQAKKSDMAGAREGFTQFLH